MLIKLAGHHINNPNHIDKVISIKGLPEEWIFRKTVNGKELVRPWTPDNEDTIPNEIRHLCEPTEITITYSPIGPGIPGVVDKRTILGIKLDFNTEPGRELWEKVERYLDRMTPRDQKVPEPVMMAPNHKSIFDPHIGRRGSRGSLEIGRTTVPDVDLRTTIEEVIPKVEVKPIILPPTIEVKPEEKKPLFKCECGKEFSYKGPFMSHKRVHKVKIGV